MKHLLVPTDFSENALNASFYAMELAHEFKAKITLLNVYHIPNPLKSLPLEIILTPDELKTDTDSALKQQRIKMLNVKSTDVEIDCLSRNGFTVKEINDTASFLDADLIVMGMRGAGFIREAIIGSMTTSLLEKSEKPILVVPERCTFKKPVNIAFASDGKDPGDEANLHVLIELAAHFQSEIHLVNINHPKDIIDKDAIADQLETNFGKMKHTYHFIESDKVNDSISQFAMLHKIDLLTMSTKKHNLFEKLFSLSHTRHLAFHAEIPLLVLHHS